MKTGMRNRHSRGFTLVEILAVTALLVILLGIASVGVARYVRLLKIVELDNAAREIYLAAENRAVLLDNGGQLKNAVGVKDDADNKFEFVVGTETVALEGAEETTALYYISSEDHLNEVKTLVPVGSIDPTLRERYYYIVYEPVSGCVTDVFYAEKPLDTLTNPSPVFSFADFYKNWKNAPRAERMKLEPMLGYYGGGMAERAPVELLKTPKVRVIIHNEERLWVEVTFEVDEKADADDVVKNVKLTYGDKEVDLMTPEYKGRLTGPESSNSGDYAVYKYQWVLDELVNAEQNKTARTFRGLVGEGISLGGDFTVTATVSSGSGKFSTESDSDTDNTLFDEESVGKNIAHIKYLRHLQNLNKDSGFAEGSGKEQAVQTETIRCKTNSTYTNYNFIPIENDFLTSYDGGKKEIRDLYIKDAGRASGLFSTSPAGASYTNVRLVNAEVKGSGEAAKKLAAGALIGETEGEVSIDGCWVYWDTAEKPNLRDVLGSNEEGSSYNYMITGATAGGLVGRMWDGTITNSFAATTVEGSDVAGGLIGECSGSVTVQRSYADCYLAGKNAAGLIGELTVDSSAQVTYCYTAGFIDASKAAEAAGFCLGGGTTTSLSSYSAIQTHGENASLAYCGLVKTGQTPDNLQKTYYWSRNKEDALAKSYAQMISTTGTNGFMSQLGAPNEFSMKKAGAATEVEKSHPYNLRVDLTLGDYVFPGLKELPHYGDWDTDVVKPLLAYYEEYTDEVGFYGRDEQRAIDALSDKSVSKDGYAVAFLQSNIGYETQVRITFTYTNEDGETKSKEVLYAKEKLLKVSFKDASNKQNDYFLAPLPPELVVSGFATEDYFRYLKFEISIGAAQTDADKATEEYLYNPHFAKAILPYSGENAAAKPDTVFVRTPRHLWDLSLFPEYQNKGYRFRQELDLDYAQYTGYSLFDQNETDKQAPIGDQTIPFNGEYDGECHTIEGVAFQVPEGGQLSCAGLFGVSEGQLKNVVYKMEADAPHRVALSGATNLYIGGLVGVNRSTVYNCAVEGVNVVAASSGSALYAGGLAGRNEGIIKNCGAEAARLAVDCSQYSKAYLGGLVGENAQGDSIASSYAVGRISAVVDGTSEAVLCGFAGTNQGTINNSYAAVDLRADGVGAATTAKMTKHGFSDNSDNKGQTNECYYLNNGNFTYREKTYAALYKDESGATPRDNITLTTSNIPGMGKATNNEFPYPTGVENGKDENVHYGKWPEPIELGSFGVYYWEKMEFPGTSEAESGYSGYYVSLLAVDTKDNTVEKKSTLLTDHNDGGVVTEWGYGYYCEEEGDYHLAEEYSFWNYKWETNEFFIDSTINSSIQIFCKNPQNLVKQRITPHFLIAGHPNYYEFTTKG